MPPRKLTTELTAPPPVPAAAADAALEVLRGGDLFRYSPSGEARAQAAAFEQEFAAWCGRKYAVALNSCGSSIFVALKAAGIEDRAPVLFNAFTLAPVPGAIEHANGEPVAVDCGEDLLVDLEDLTRKQARTGAKVFLLSHMRGHIANMRELVARCVALDLLLIEDCAHTMGASWDGQLTGTFGALGCFSTQSYKHLNSGEGGVLVTDDPAMAAHAIVRSGSYALYASHRARPPESAFDAVRTQVPNCSLRMSNLVAALLRPQLAELPARAQAWRHIYARLEAGLAKLSGVQLIPRDPREAHVPSSLQFILPKLSAGAVEGFLASCATHGLPLVTFASREPVGFVGRCEHWAFVRDAQLSRLPGILDRLVDFRLPLSLSDEDCDIAIEIIEHALEQVTKASSQA